LFADPQTVTVNAVAQTLAAVSREKGKSVYREDIGEYELVISHNETPRRNRRTVRLNRVKTTTDPFIPAQNVEVSHSVYLVIDTPIAGFSASEMDDDIAGLTAWLTSANVLKVLGGES
jgi:hypothetical protein